MRIARYDSMRDAFPKSSEVSWQELASLLSVKRETPCAPCVGHKCPHKDGAAWSPVDIVGARANVNVRAVTALVLDVDSVPENVLQAPLDALEGRGLACLVYSTHAHAPPAWSLRLVFPLSRPVAPAQWSEFRRAAIRSLGLDVSFVEVGRVRPRPLVDDSAKDMSRLYFLPSGPKGSTFFAMALEGSELDVDAILKEATPSPAPQVVAVPRGAVEADSAESLPAPPSGYTVADVRKLLKRVDTDSKSLLELVLAGGTIAEEGSRDATLNRVCSSIAAALPLDVPEETVLHVLRPSLLAMPGSESLDYWLAEAADMLRRARTRKLRREDAKEMVLKALAVPLELVEAATELGVEVVSTEKYTEDQIAEWAEAQGTDVAGFEKRWVIQHDRAYFVFVDGDYRKPLTRDAIGGSLPRDFQRAPIRLYVEDAAGNLRARKTQEILGECLTVAREVRSSLVLQRSRYDAATETFYEAVCPLRPVKATQHADVDAWLRLLGGSRQEQLLDWVATMSRLDRQTCAVYFIGVKGVGKSLFAEGMARLWVDGGPSELDNVLGAFNGSIAHCPLIFADEQVGKTPGLTAKLRKLIGSSSRQLTRKFLPTTSLEGAVRLIIAGNNDNLLETEEDLTVEDSSAVASRFLPIHSDPRAASYLSEIGQDEISTEWVPYKIAEHAVWLAQTREVNTQNRFLVEGDTSEMTAKLAVGSNSANNVASWLAGWLQEKQPPPANGQVPKVLVGDGELLVGADAMASEAQWGRYIASARPLSRSRINRALKGLSAGEQRVRLCGQHPRYHRVNIELLLSFAEEHQYDVDAIKARLAAPAEWKK